MLEMKQIRKMTGLSQIKFSEQYNIPRRTIEDWETGKMKCPDYVLELLEFKVKYDLGCLEEN